MNQFKQIIPNFLWGFNPKLNWNIEQIFSRKNASVDGAITRVECENGAITRAECNNE